MPPLRVVVSIELHDRAKNMVAFERIWSEGPPVVFSPLDEKHPLMHISFTYGERTLRLPIKRATWDTESCGWMVEAEFPSLGAPPHILDGALKAFQGDLRWKQIRPLG